MPEPQRTVERRLDILYVGTFPPHRGGSAILSAQILRGLARRGHRMRVLAPIAADASEEGDRDSGCATLEVARFVMPYLDGSADTPPPEEYRQLEAQSIETRFAPLVYGRRPDVVIVGRESFAWHVPHLARRHGLSSVALVQGTTTMGILNGSYPQELAQGLLERLRQVELVCTPARHMAATLAKLGLPGVEVVPNPVDLDRFRPGPRPKRLARVLGMREDDVVAVHLSNMKALKRPLDLVESAREALQRDSRLLYVVVGEGDRLAATQAACAERGVAHRFRFVPWADHEDVPDYVRLADLVLMPSAAEAQALVYLEAQATARTLVASDIPGAREVVVDGETGLLFRAADIADLTAKTLLAAGDPKLRAAIGRRAREHVRSHALPDVVTRYEQLLASVVDRTATPRRPMTRSAAAS